MTEKDLAWLLRTHVPVLWQGRTEYERSVGYVSAIIHRMERGALVCSCELTTHTNPRSILRCRPEDIRLWFPEDTGQERGAYTEAKPCVEESR